MFLFSAWLRLFLLLLPALDLYQLFTLSVSYHTPETHSKNCLCNLYSYLICISICSNVDLTIYGYGCALKSTQNDYKHWILFIELKIVYIFPKNGEAFFAVYQPWSMFNLCFLRIHVYLDRSVVFDTNNHLNLKFTDLAYVKTD